VNFPLRTALNSLLQLMCVHWLVLNLYSYWTGWTAFSLSYKPWSLTCRKRSIVYCCVTSQRSRDPSILLCDPAFTASHSNKWRRVKRGEGRRGQARLNSVPLLLRNNVPRSFRASTAPTWSDYATVAYITTASNNHYTSTRKELMKVLHQFAKELTKE
jgi:hypothetical protein